MCIVHSTLRDATTTYTERYKLKLLIAISIISVLFLSACVSEQNTEQKVEFIRESLDEFYLRGYGFYLKIQLFSDNTFLNEVNDYHGDGYERKKEVFGTFDESENKIIFHPSTVVLNINSIEEEDRTDTLAYSYSDSTKIQTIYYKVDVNGISVLVSDAGFNENNETFPRSSSIIALANMYNAGGEFPIHKRLLSNTDTTMSLESLKVNNQVPSEWKEYFLKASISAKVEDVKLRKVESEWGNSALIPNYHLSSASASMLKPGMKMYPIDGSCERIGIESIDGESIKGIGSNQFWEATKCVSGKVLSTRIEKTI
jgi:hypothetical protein